MEKYGLKFFSLKKSIGLYFLMPVNVDTWIFIFSIMKKNSLLSWSEYKGIIILSLLLRLNFYFLRELD